MTRGAATSLACAHATEQAAAQSATPIQREVYRAWRLSPDASRGEAIPLETAPAASLAEALDNALAGNVVCHKDHVAILVTDTVTGRRMLHLYAIRRQSAPQFRWDAGQQRHLRFHRHYPVALFAMAVNEFVPVEPWTWAPGRDAVGYGGAPAGMGA